MHVHIYSTLGSFVDRQIFRVHYLVHHSLSAQSYQHNKFRANVSILIMERPPRSPQKDVMEQPARRPARKPARKRARSSMIMKSLSWTKDLVNPLTKLVNPELLVDGEDVQSPRPVEVISFAGVV